MEQDSNNQNDPSPSALVDARLEAFAMCMICNAEFPPDRTECPKCRVALSMVRRCHNCSRVVSAKHQRCIHCGQAFFPEGQDAGSQEDVLDRIAALRKQREVTKHRKTLRALSVSVATFVVVAFLAMSIAKKFGSPGEAAIVASSYLLQSADLRRAPSESSSTMGMLAGGDAVEISGFATGNHERRWIAVQRKEQTGYLEANVIAPPKCKEAIRGADLLKFYIAGIEDPSLITEAAKAVAYYNHAFPAFGSIGQELRWVLAERARFLAARGESKDELLAAARAQYQLLIDANGDFAEKARLAINAPLRVRGRAERESGGKRRPELTVVGSQADAETVTGFSRNPAHEVILLERANIVVRWLRPAAVKEPAVIGCTVAQNVESNRRLVIPAGAPCHLKVVNAQDKSATLVLTAVEVRNRSYELRTSKVRIQSKNLASQASPQEITFRLEAPVAFTN